MKRLTLLLACLSFANLSMADIFHLNNGTKLEGSILEDLGDSLKLRIKVTRSIYDEKVVKKSDITKTESVDPSEAEFEKLNKQFPIPDLQSVEQYRELALTSEKFLADHPKSAHSPTVKNWLIELENELVTIKLGGAKLNGELIQKTDIITNQYEYDAAILNHQFETLIKSKNSRAALDVFLDLNKDYLHTKPHQKAKETVLKILPNYMATISKAIESSSAELKERDAKLANMSASLRARTEEFLRKENLAYEAKLDAAKEAKVSLLPLHKSRPDIMKEVLRQLTELDSKLQGQAKLKSIDAGEIYRNTRKALIEEDVMTAVTYASELQRVRIPRSYSNIITEEIRDLKLKLAEDKKELLRKIEEAKRKARAANKGK